VGMYYYIIYAITMSIAVILGVRPLQSANSNIVDVNIMVGNRSSCHGVKINNIVITAAHCIKTGENYAVSVNLNGNIHTYKTSRSYVHPSYKRNANDIGILILSKSDSDGSISLENIFPKNGNASKSFFTIRTINFDYEIRKPVADDQYYDLERTHKFSAGSPIFKVKYQFLQGKKYICQGGSGAPVYTFYNDRIMLYGIITKGVSIAKGHFGENCGDTLAVENITEYTDWIKELLNQ
jgi:V8-like Glu-specific endopeptidase